MQYIFEPTWAEGSSVPTVLCSAEQPVAWVEGRLACLPSADPDSLPLPPVQFQERNKEPAGEFYTSSSFLRL